MLNKILWYISFFYFLNYLQYCFDVHYNIFLFLNIYYNYISATISIEKTLQAVGCVWVTGQYVRRVVEVRSEVRGGLRGGGEVVGCGR